MDQLNNVITLPEKQVYSNLESILEKIFEPISGLPSPPYPPGNVRLLREAGPLLFSLCRYWGSWDLEADAVVIPISPDGSVGSFGGDWEYSMVRDRASIVASERPFTADEPRFDPEPYSFSTSETGPVRTRRLLFATFGETPPSVSQAVSASVAALRRAAGEPGVETLILPLVDSLEDDSERVLSGRKEQILRGLIDGFDPHWKLNDLKHVIVPMEDAELFSELNLREPPVPVKSQEFENDKSRGEDQLGVESEVKALADAIALRDLTPPLVVGILGGWGTGKSFVLHLLCKRLQEIRCWDVSDVDVRDKFPFVGHPYLVRFDAWTYAKENLWASLMHTILEEMNQQLQLEKHINEVIPDQLYRGLDIWTIIDALKSNELELLGQEFGQDVLRSLENAPLEEHLVEVLWRGLRREHKRQRELLEQATNEREQIHANYLERLRKVESALLAQRQTLEEDVAEREREVTAHLRGDLQRAQGELERREAKIRDEFERSSLGVAAWQPTASRLSQIFGKELFERLADQIPAEARSSGSAVLALLPELRSWRSLLSTWRQNLSPAHAVYLLVAIGGIPLVWMLSDQLLGAVNELWPVIASLMTFLGAAAGSIATALRTARERIEEENDRYQLEISAQHAEADIRLERDLREKLSGQRQLIRDLEQQLNRASEKARAAARRKASQSEAELEVQHRQLERERNDKIREIEQRIADYSALVDQHPEGPTVHEIIQERLRSGHYTQHLGLVHQVQQDLRQLSQALLSRDEEMSKHFPRGNPRIFLVIDDLDRCPPEAVVQVLEAAQLLVKTELFVVVLAMDVRYVTRSLEKQYKDILVADGVPSGLDYIEKIVQMPYRVPDIEPKAMRPFLGAQIQVMTNEPTTVTLQEKDEQIGEKQSEAKKIVFYSSKTVADLELQPLPENVQKFSRDELNLLNECCKAVEISPRSAKRLVNVFKLMKIIWHHRGAHSEPDINVKRAMMLFLVLAARQPVVMRDVLRDLDGYLRREEPDTLARGLAELLSERIRAAKTGENKRAVNHLAEVVTRHDLLSESLKLGDVEFANLRLVRSFSFVGETVEEIDITASAESGAKGSAEDPPCAQSWANGGAEDDPCAEHMASGESSSVAGTKGESNVTKIKGIGPRFGEMLAECCVHTLNEFAQLTESEVTKILPVSEKRARDFLDSAKRLLGCD